MRVCVVGGTGNISTGIVRALLEFGHEVSVFTRGSRESRLPSAVQYLLGDRQTESIMPGTTPRDMLKSRTWAEPFISDAEHLPISFVYGGRKVNGIPSSWDAKREDRRVDAASERYHLVIQRA